jgi:hypothetical protein
MMAVKSVIFILLITSTALSFAQPDKSLVGTEENLKNISRSAAFIMTTNMDELYEGIKGTPYLFNQWKQGNIYLNDNTYINDVNIKYNIYTDDVLYLHSKSGDSLIIDRSLINSFEITDDNSGNLVLFKEISLRPDKNDKSTFVKVLYDGKSKFIIKYTKTFIKADYKGAYSAGRKYDEYIDDYQYYIITNSTDPVKIKLNKKSVAKALSDKEDKIQSYLNEHHLNLNDEYGIAELLEYYDSISN